ncbi:MAG: shikimate kinase [Myxococcota bacterium]
MTRHSTVWLVGMMGAGKSKVGRALAERLGLPFADTDADVVARSGRSIADLFSAEGEAAFRALEREAIEARAGEQAVVSLGGGAIAQPGTAALLRRTGTLVYLRATPATLLDRLGDCSGRPLLAGLTPEERAEHLVELLRERSPYYEKADVVVDVDGRSAEENTRAVARGLAGR